MKTIFRLLALVLLLCMVQSCLTSDNDFEKGKEQLESQGYTDVENTGHNMFCCDESDGFSTGFKAKAKDGTEVKGCFCSSLLKGITIRYE